MDKQYFAACERDFVKRDYFATILQFNEDDIYSRPLASYFGKESVQGGEISNPVENQIERLNREEMLEFKKHLEAMKLAYQQLAVTKEGTEYVEALKKFYHDKDYLGTNAEDIANKIPCDRSTLYRKRSQLMVYYARTVYPMWVISEEVQDESDPERAGAGL